MNRRYQKNYDGFGDLSPEEMEEQMRILRDYENRNSSIQQESKSPNESDFRHADRNYDVAPNTNDEVRNDLAGMDKSLEPKIRGCAPPRILNSELLSQILTLNNDANRTMSPRAGSVCKQETAPPIHNSSELLLMSGKEDSPPAHFDEEYFNESENQFLNCKECGCSISVSKMACLVTCPTCWSVSPILSSK